MGRIRTPAYRVELKTLGFYLTPAAWNIRGDGLVHGNGKPTHANLKKYVESIHKSFEPGGANAHIGYLRIIRATIIRQADDEVMATWSSEADRMASEYRPTETAA